MTDMIAYATVEGQTGKIAGFIETQLGKLGREVTLCDLSDETQSISLDGIDRVILAAPVHERRHPEAFEVFLASQRKDLETHPTLLLSISLSAAFEDGQDEAQDYLDEMKMRTGFTPGAEACIAGAVRSSSYDYFAAQVVKHVVLRNRDYDPTAQEHEFTDWEALASLVSDFAKAA